MRSLKYFHLSLVVFCFLFMLLDAHAKLTKREIRYPDGRVETEYYDNSDDLNKSEEQSKPDEQKKPDEPKKPDELQFSVNCEKTINDAKAVALELKDKHKKALISRHAISKMRILSSIRSYYSFSDIKNKSPIETEDLINISKKIESLKLNLSKLDNDEMINVTKGMILEKEKEYNNLLLSNAWNAINSANSFALKDSHPSLKLDSFDKNYFFSYFKDRENAFGGNYGTSELIKKDISYMIDDFSKNFGIELNLDDSDLNLIAPITLNTKGEAILEKSFEDGLNKVFSEQKKAHDLTDSIYKKMNKQLVANTKACITFLNNSIYECKLSYFNQGKISDSIDPLFDIFHYFSENGKLSEPDLDCNNKVNAESKGLNFSSWKVVDLNCFCSLGSDACCLTEKGFTYVKEINTCSLSLACTGPNEIKVKIEKNINPTSCACDKGYRWNTIDKKCVEFSKCESLSSDKYALDFWATKNSDCNCSKNDDTCCVANSEDGNSYYFKDNKCVARSLSVNTDEPSSDYSNFGYDFDKTIKRAPPRFRPIIVPGGDPIILMPGQF